MEPLTLAIGSAFWLGLLTSISPCPLATNIVAISYLGRRTDSPHKVLLSGLVFTLGRMVAYAGLATILVSSLLAVPEVALFLQRYMNRILGPLLIVVGLMLMGVLRAPSFGPQASEELQRRSERFGIWGAGLMGLIFALSFCPVSAALYFGSLIPLATKAGQPVLLPLVYGVGTGLPVVGVAVLLAMGVKSIGAVYARLARVERWATLATSLVTISVGIYYVWLYLL